LEPEILIVDEVLAVGDADFQKKCLNKMDDVGKSGRTVLFVSHNMHAVARLCSRCILLNGGRLVDEGPSEMVISRYLNSELGTSAAREWNNIENSPGKDVAKLRAIRIISGKSDIVEHIDINQPFRMEMEYDVIASGYVLLPNFHVYNEHGVEVFAVVDLDPKWRQKKRPKGRYVSAVEVPGNIMAEGNFTIKAVLHTLNPLAVEFTCPSVASFTIIDKQDGTTARGDYVGKLPGVMRPKLNWKTDYRSLDY
jgi:lipopolysaccharide transport system ATP-binding protein